MSIQFMCPAGHLLKAAENKVERQVSCPICGQQAIVPAQGEGACATGSPEVVPAEAVEEAAVKSRPEPPKPPPLPSHDSKTEAQRRLPKPRPESRENGGADLPPPLPATRKSQARPERGLRLHAVLGPSPCLAEWSTDRAYRPDLGIVQTVRWLASLLGVLVLFSTVPALPHLDLQLAPGWARAVLLLAALQTCYVLWMAATPDWSTVRVVMMVFAAVSALYGMATAVAIATPPDSPMPLGMGEVRTSAARWCGAILLLMSLATYLCGRVSAKWQRRWRLRPAGQNQ